MREREHSLRFLGATGTVTGSRYLLESGGRRILVDCGMFQGLKELRERNRSDFAVPPDSIDLVVLSHAHLDHSGYVPALVKHGFRGEVLTSEGTAELLTVMWPDSAHLLAEEAERANRHGYTKHAPATPLYDIDDVNEAISRIRTARFNDPLTLAPDVTVEFLHAGHILGASQLRFTVAGTRVHFTGDLGRPSDPLMNPPEPFTGSDILVTESTYGDRVRPRINAEEEIGSAIRPVLERGGVVLIPSFAVGRAQSLMLHLSRLMNAGAIPRVPIYLNSPMATSATEMYKRHREEHRVDPQEFADMYDVAHMVRSVEESKALNQRHGPMVIIAPSGMMTGGRVLHHLVEFGADPNNAIVISGYQAVGTRGRMLADGAETLRIFGRDVPIRAEVIELHTM
ncbi:MAG: MBL fold metallo-hydrolase, partial [Agromyces sp.]